MIHHFDNLAMTFIFIEANNADSKLTFSCCSLPAVGLVALYVCISFTIESIVLIVLLFSVWYRDFDFH